MIRHIADFAALYARERAGTMRLLEHVTQASLAQKVSPQGRTLGFLAWHIAATIPEMFNLTGLGMTELDGNTAPDSIEEIRSAYAAASQEVLDKVGQQWSDADLATEDSMYGEQWTRSETLLVLITHEIHHRGQLTVLMRQAGLRVPGLYGPAQEEWAEYGLATHP